MIAADREWMASGLKRRGTLLAPGVVMAASDAWGQATAVESSLADFLVLVLERAAADFRAVSGVRFAHGQVALGGHVVRFTPVPESAQAVGLRHAAGVRVEVCLDGHHSPRLTAAAVGTGDSLEHAQRLAIVQWYMQFGATLMLALAARPAAFVVDGRSFFPGPSGLLVPGPAERAALAADPAFDARRLIEAIAGSLPQSDAGFGAIHVKLAFEPLGPAQGEVHVDGSPSPIALRRLLALPWPGSTRGYAFKRSFTMR